jgi:hypothetical protein
MYKPIVRFFKRHKPSERKLRLFAIACCRHVTKEPSLLKSLQIAENYTEGKISDKEMLDRAFSYAYSTDICTAVFYALVGYKSIIDGREYAANAAYYADRTVYQGHWTSKSPEWAWQKNLLRHMFGIKRRR